MVEKVSLNPPPQAQLFVQAVLQHPCSGRHEIVLEESELFLEVDWSVQLSSRDAGTGASYIGIKEVEPVTFVIPHAFPRESPTIILRSDFPREHVPHIYPGVVGGPVYPCISETGIKDLIFQDGISGVLRSLQHWLDRAAQGLLMNPSQGWEPILFQNVAGVFLGNPNQILGALDAGAQSASSRFAYSLIWSNRIVLSEQYVYANKLGKKCSEDTNIPVIVIKVPFGSASRKFQHIDVRNRENLYSLLEHTGLSGDNLSWLKAEIEKKGSEGLEHLFLVVVVRRPMNLIGANHHFEILPFDCVLTTKASRKAKVSPLQYREAANATMLQRVSSRSGRQQKLLHFIGAGSVGSKISLSLAKTGDYSFQLTDKSLFSPHNLARHAICEPSANDGFPKVLYLQNAIAGALSVECKISTADASLPSFAIVGAPDAIVESTGSAAVSANLRDTEFDAQLYQVGLYAEAELAFLAAEPRNRTRCVRVDDIEAWLYQQGLEHRELGRLLFAANTHNREIVGPACSSFTTVVSDPKLGLQAAALAERLDATLQNWPFDDDQGMGAYCLRLPQSGDLNWSKAPLSKTTVFPIIHDGAEWEIRVLASVTDVMRERRKDSGQNETGGAILGRFDSLLRTIHVTGLVAPPANAVAGPSLFQINYAHLRQVDEDTLGRTAGTLRVLGTWHSHVGTSRPSGIDRRTFGDLKQNLGLPFPVMVVCGNDGVELVDD